MKKTKLLPMTVLIAFVLLAVPMGCARAAYPPEYAMWRKQVVAGNGGLAKLTSSPALMFVAAASMGDRDLIATLRKRDNDIDAPDPQSGQPALIMAILADATTATSTLLECGASPNVFDESVGSPALLDATGNKTLETMRMLLKHGANPDLAHRTLRQTPLQATAVDNEVDAAKLLLEYKANPNLGDAHGVTPLHLAALKNHAELARLLIKYGANPNQTSDRGTSPLIVAQREKHEGMIQLLKNAGAKDMPDPLLNQAR